MPGIITTLAGTGAPGYGGDGGLAVSAQLHYPHGVAIDWRGDVFIVDSSNHRVRKLAIATGSISTVVGSGVAGYSGDGGAATSARMHNPHVVVVDHVGNLFIGDQDNHRIRRVDAATGIITTVAGTGTAGFGGDGGPATSAVLNGPIGVGLDSAGHLLIADHKNHRIRQMEAPSGFITTIVGNGCTDFNGDGIAATSACLCFPTQAVAHHSGRLYLTDQHHHRVRVVFMGIITTVAGTGAGGFSGDGGPATSARLFFPQSIAVDSPGNVYIADPDNSRVRVISALTGAISTLAGDGVAGPSGDGGPASSARVNYPRGIALDLTGNVVVADTDNHRIRVISALVQPTTAPTASPSRTPYCAPVLYRPLPRMDLVGALVGTALSPGAATLVATEAHCRQACCDAAACDGYAFDAATATIHAVSHCYLYVNVTQLIPSSNFVSGIHTRVL